MQEIKLPYEKLYKVIKDYANNRLAYHNWEHITEMFMIADNLGIELSQAQNIAILYHDIVYDINRKDNEEQSASYMQRELGETDIDDKVIKTASMIIMDTKHHIPTIDESAIVIDLDMVHLSFDFDIFLYYRDKIRKEYSKISDKEFYQGENYFFENLLKQNKILFTKYFSEEQLRQNLKQKILINLEEIHKTDLEAEK